MTEAFELIPMCVSHELKDLTGIPHRDIDGTDLAIVARHNDSIVNGVSIDDEKLPDEEVIEEALLYKPEYRMESLENLLGIPEEARVGSTEVYALYSGIGQFGASVLGYPEELEKKADQFGEGFYILPSSVHEVLIIPFSRSAGMKPADMQKMVSEVNVQTVREEERLSNSVYQFEGGKLSVVAGPATASSGEKDRAVE